MSELSEKHPTMDQIERRAYEIYLARGCEDGHDVSDWLAAEKEIREFTQGLLQELIENLTQSHQASGEITNVTVEEPQKAHHQKLLPKPNGKRNFITASR